MDGFIRVALQSRWAPLLNFYIDVITSSRHRMQVAKALCDARTLPGRTDAVMNACCPSSGGGHRRLQADCALPDACPSVACAASFVEFYDDCRGQLQAHADVLPLRDFSNFYSSCQSLDSGSGVEGERVRVERAVRRGHGDQRSDVREQTTGFHRPARSAGSS